MNPVRVLQVVSGMSQTAAILCFAGVCLLALGFCVAGGLLIRAFPREETKFQQIELLSVPNTHFTPTTEEELDQNKPIRLSDEERFRTLARLADEKEISVHGRNYIFYVFTIEGVPFSYIQDFPVPRWYAVRDPLRFEGHMASRNVYRSRSEIGFAWLHLFVASLIFYVMLTNPSKKPFILFPWAFLMRPPGCTQSC